MRDRAAQSNGARAEGKTPPQRRGRKVEDVERHWSERDSTGVLHVGTGFRQAYPRRTASELLAEVVPQDCNESSSMFSMGTPLCRAPSTNERCPGVVKMYFERFEQLPDGTIVVHEEEQTYLTELVPEEDGSRVLRMKVWEKKE